MTVVRRNLESLAPTELNWLATFVHARADLGALGVQHDGDVFVGSHLHSLAQAINTSAVSLKQSEKQNYLPRGLRAKS